MKNLFLCAFIVCVMSGTGCARVRVEAPKDPIKVDVSMRLDIYQHVAKDIDAIEGIVSGDRGKAPAFDKSSCLFFFVRPAYAQALEQNVEDAALRRKDRLQELESWQAQGVIGENLSAFVEIRNSEGKDQAALLKLIEAENADRLVIYQSVSKKNGVTIDSVRKLYAIKLQQNAPSGTPVETPNGWQIK